MSGNTYQSRLEPFPGDDVEMFHRIFDTLGVEMLRKFSQIRDCQLLHALVHAACCAETSDEVFRLDAVLCRLHAYVIASLVQDDHRLMFDYICGSKLTTKIHKDEITNAYYKS